MRKKEVFYSVQPRMHLTAAFTQSFASKEKNSFAGNGSTGSVSAQEAEVGSLPVAT